MLGLANKETLVAHVERCGVAACPWRQRPGARAATADSTYISLVSKRGNAAFLIREVREIIPSMGSRFTPCQPSPSLLEAVAEAARNATSGDVVLLSPACSGLDQFRNYQHRGQVFCAAAKSIGGGDLAPSPHMHGCPVPA